LGRSDRENVGGVAAAHYPPLADMYGSTDYAVMKIRQEPETNARDTQRFASAARIVGAALTRAPWIPCRIALPILHARFCRGVHSNRH
jgi:hypothetical protein